MTGLRPLQTVSCTLMGQSDGMALDTPRRLRGRLPPGWQIVLFSQENHFIFTPLLGDVVGASINPMHVVWPIRQMARKVKCLTAALTGADLQQQWVTYRAP